MVWRRKRFITYNRTEFREETFEIREVRRFKLKKTVLVIEFSFYRRLTLSFITIYFPSALIVLISFVSFWLDSQSVPGRVSLVITSLLTLITQLLHIRSQLPAISCVTALDIWFFVCVSFISSALFEFALAYNFSRKVSDAVTVARVTEQTLQREGMHENLVRTERIAQQLYNHACFNHKTRYERIFESIVSVNLDRVCKLAFPVAFVVFLVVYWSYYLMA